MKNASHSEAQANNSTPILSAIVGSSWDACDENSLAVDGLDAIPYETLEASGIPRDPEDHGQEQCSLRPAVLPNCVNTRLL